MSDICFILITCHGQMDLESIVPVPTGKIIIKKNLAPFAKLAFGDLRKNKIDYSLSPMIEEEKDRDVLFPDSSPTKKASSRDRSPSEPPVHVVPPQKILDMRLRQNNEKIRRHFIEEEDIGKCVPYEEYKDICNVGHPIQYPYHNLVGVEKFYPIGRTCMILTDQTEYYMRDYTVEKQSVDKIIVMVKNPMIPDIPSEPRRHQDYLQYNLFNPKDTWELLKLYSYVWRNNTELSNQVHGLMNDVYGDPVGWTNTEPVSEENPYSHKLRTPFLHTGILFFIIGLLPQHTIKILDMSCAGVSFDIKDPSKMETFQNAYLDIVDKRRGWGKNKRSHKIIKRSNNKNNHKKISHKKRRKMTRKK